jgi:hypothetical protein
MTQLDLWTKLFSEPDMLLSHRDIEKSPNAETLLSRSEEDGDLNLQGGATAYNGHGNVVTGNTIATTNNDDSTSVHVPQASSFDLNQFLAKLGIDLFSVPNSQLSLDQLLSLHSRQTMAELPLSSPTTSPPSSQDATSLLSAERVHSCKPFVHTSQSSDTHYSPSFPNTDPNATTAVTPIEHKRIRNTASSTRSRMKKKERQEALEEMAKELETRENTLRRECEDLRRENSWLKGLVVHVTGAQLAST